jgi:hypothetical protein
MSRDLEGLRLEMQKRSVDTDAKSPGVFTEADVRIFKVRLAIVTEAEDNLFADKITASLNYVSRPVRLNSVPQAHRDTFQWAFDSRLSEWFRSGSGTFWVSGKPGSGKSTFMKFISRHPQTMELLADWAGSDKLAVAAHFFWIAGTPIQKSWQGLLQSLLFGVLHKHPSVVPLVSPNRWAAAKAGRWQAAAEPWSVTELSAALRALASAGNIPLKMCFFIDGLDEYDSDHAELCKVLRDMTSSPRVKICLSSRPWAVFDRNFGGDSKERLDIHELTRNDIRRFVTDQLQTHPRWALEEPQEAGPGKAELVERIVAQSDGVFLWSFFVTRSLREGLSNGETTADLHEHLNGLPTDLEQLFKRMLECVDSTDQPKMAAILLAATHALEPLHIDLYWHLEMELEDHDYAYRCPIGARPFDRVLEQREQTSRSINDKTKGLLKLVNQRVEFLHRTVKDFVSTRDMGLYLRSKLPEDYNGLLSISTAYLGLLKTTRQDHSMVAGIVRQGRGLNSGPFISQLNTSLMYASEALKSGQSSSPHHHHTTALLNKYEIAVEAMVRAGHVTIGGYDSEGCNPGLPFREELLKHNLTPYIAERVREQPDFFDIFDAPPLFAALVPMSLSSGESPAPVPGVLDIILRHGGDPNALLWSRASGVSEATSPWMLFARVTFSFFHMLSKPCIFPALRFNDALDHGIFDLLLSHGADPNKTLIDRPGAHTAFSQFLDISLSKFLGEECFDGYLRTLDAFLRAGASLGVPSIGATSPDVEAAFGNLARSRPKESVLISYCTKLKGLLASLAADPERARFVSSVTEKIIFYCSGTEEDLGELSLAISEGIPRALALPLLGILDEMSKKQGETRKRHRESLGDWPSGSGAKHLRV